MEVTCLSAVEGADLGFNLKFLTSQFMALLSSCGGYQVLGLCLYADQIPNRNGELGCVLPSLRGE